MNDLSPLRPAQSGVFLPSRATPALRKIAERSRCPWLDVRLSGVRDKAGFLAACARDLKFPAHFGGNWDAFADSINDMSWIAGGGFVLGFAGVEPFARTAPDEWATALEILRSAADAWRARNRTFVVLLDHAPHAA